MFQNIAIFVFKCLAGIYYCLGDNPVTIEEEVVQKQGRGVLATFDELGRFFKRCLGDPKENKLILFFDIPPLHKKT